MSKNTTLCITSPTQISYSNTQYKKETFHKVFHPIFIPHSKLKILSNTLINNTLIFASDGSATKTTAAAAAVCYDTISNTSHTYSTKCPVIYDNISSLYPESIGIIAVINIIKYIENHLNNRKRKYLYASPPPLMSITKK